MSFPAFVQCTREEDALVFQTTEVPDALLPEDLTQLYIPAQRQSWWATITEHHVERALHLSSTINFVREEMKLASMDIFTVHGYQVENEFAPDRRRLYTILPSDDLALPPRGTAVALCVHVPIRVAVSESEAQCIALDTIFPLLVEYEITTTTTTTHSDTSSLSQDDTETREERSCFVRPAPVYDTLDGDITSGFFAPLPHPYTQHDPKAFSWIDKHVIQTFMTLEYENTQDECKEKGEFQVWVSRDWVNQVLPSADLPPVRKQYVWDLHFLKVITAAMPQIVCKETWFVSLLSVLKNIDSRFWKRALWSEDPRFYIHLQQCIE